MEDSMEIPQKIKNRNTSYPTSEYLSKYYENTNLKRYMDPHVHIIIYNSQYIEQLKCLLPDEWIKKMWYIYFEILLSHSKRWILAICDNMHGPQGYYAKWNKSDEERWLWYQIPYDFIHGKYKQLINKNKYMNKPNQTKTNT